METQENMANLVKAQSNQPVVIATGLPVCQKIIVVSSAGPGWFADFLTEAAWGLHRRPGARFDLG